MGNVNYIASAGTGKTHSLVSNIIEKISKENVSLKNMLILTFTDKAASELKEKIALRIKEEINKSQNKKLHEQLIYIDSGYIGTFHSVFLRLLKKYPEISKIDNSFNIIASEETLKDFVYIYFEKWIEQDFYKDKQTWEEIISIFEGKPKNIKSIFFSLYKNRIRLKKEKKDLKKQKKEIKNLASNLENTLNNLFNRYKNLFKTVKNHYDSKFFEIDIFKIKTILDEERYQDLPNGKKIFKNPRYLSEEEKNFYKNKIKPTSKDENFNKLQEDLILYTEKLKTESLDYNANLILEKYFPFENYINSVKQKEKLIDFNDILIKVRDLVSYENVKNKIKNKFKYIFIDEFQDTDILQTEIIKEISNNNIYVFGDPKQCIYTWRDADLNNYFKFIRENNFENKLLYTNYRSDKVLIEFFNTLITSEKILKHIEKDFKIPVKHKFNFNNSYIKYVKINSNEENGYVEKEAKYIAKEIKQIVEEGLEYRDIMVLFLKNKDLIQFGNILSEYQIPVLYSSNESFANFEEIKLVLNILKYIENPDNSIAYLNILKSPLIFAKEKEIYEKNIKNKNLDIIKSLIKKKYSYTVSQIIDEIFLNTDLMEIYSLIDKSNQKVKNLKKLKLIAKKKTIEGYSLRDFIMFLETSDIPPFYNNKENAVKLLTMHKSKGLESKVVIIPLISKRPEKIELKSINIFNGKPLFYFPKEKIVSKDIKTYEKELKNYIEHELERLFYVAITRAKEKLIFIESGKNKKSRSFKKYIENIKNMRFEVIDFENIKITPATKKVKNPENIEKILKDIKEKEHQRDKLYKKAINKKRFLSVSQLMDEEKEIPTYSFEKKQEENIGIYTGVIVHDILEAIDFENFSLKDVKNLIKDRENIIPENIRKTVKENAYKILKNFKNSEIHKELKKANILFRELPFTLYDEENDRYIEGRIDIVYEKDGKIIVMDYKTNRYETEEEKKQIIKAYQIQKLEYSKAVKKLFVDKEVEFKLGLLWKGEIA